MYEGLDNLELMTWYKYCFFRKDSYYKHNSNECFESSFLQERKVNMTDDPSLSNAPYPSKLTPKERWEDEARKKEARIRELESEISKTINIKKIRPAALTAALTIIFTTAAAVTIPITAPVVLLGGAYVIIKQLRPINKTAPKPK